MFKAKESFLLCSQDPGAHQNVIFQLTDCMIDVPIVELMPEKQETERKKIASDEGICYSLMNSAVRSYYIYPIDTTIYNYNVMNGYKAKYIFIYWVDHTHESDGDININNFILERPNLRTLDIWSDDHLIKSYLAKKGETAINWDKMYEDFIEWTGRNITSKDAWMHGRTIVPAKVDPNPLEQVQDENLFTPWEHGQITIKQVFDGRPSN